jgi:DNA mismatch endonuclease (patch repair protein)
VTDRLSRERRSWNMSRIRGKNTVPEKQVRSALHRAGYRFRLRSKQLPGRPDVVLTKYRTVDFVHGCFWHRLKGCRYAYTPKSRVAFWNAKFESNVERDRRNARELRRLGWNVVTVPECEVGRSDGWPRRWPRRSGQLVPETPHRSRPGSCRH